ncbi:AzlD domain-containing protein [uncultured Blautia sp.]|uniref:AzlD domain-containing protein n=1 Tax=Blautia sp. HCP28S3_G10 TaxID=3438908 RepID=UPI0025F87321|nr:AzlD domain-containing protein [uncultured Blautia sp.]
MMANVYVYIFVMAGVTYLIRMLPLVLFKKEITSPFVKSFLYYVPYACLAAMTFPAILTATSAGIVSGIAALIVALIAAYREKSLLTVAVCACAAVFIVERVMELVM